MNQEGCIIPHMPPQTSYWRGPQTLHKLNIPVLTQEDFSNWDRLSCGYWKATKDKSRRKRKTVRNMFSLRMQVFWEHPVNHNTLPSPHYSTLPDPKYQEYEDRQTPVSESLGEGRIKGKKGASLASSRTTASHTQVTATAQSICKLCFSEPRAFSAMRQGKVKHVLACWQLSLGAPAYYFSYIYIYCTKIKTCV